MTQIEKLVSFIEDVFRHAPSDRFEIKELENGTPILLDKLNRIRVVLHVQDIMVTKYHNESGELQDELVVSWHNLTKSQRERIIDLVDVPDDLDPEIEETLSEMLKGV